MEASRVKNPRRVMALIRMKIVAIPVNDGLQCFMRRSVSIMRQHRRKRESTRPVKDLVSFFAAGLEKLTRFAVEGACKVSLYLMAASETRDGPHIGKRRAAP